MRILKLTGAIVLLLLVIGVAILWTPDTDPDVMRAKYGGQEAKYARTAEGMDVHYRVSGPKDAPVVILIHGTSASLHTWEPLRSALEGSYRVVAYDQPGHGLTGPHPQKDYTYAGMADGLDAVFAAEAVDEAVLVGNSMGGWVAWRDGLENPHRVRGLVLLDAAGIPRSVRTSGNIGFRLLSNPLGALAMRKLTPRRAIEQSLYETVSVDEIVTDHMVDRYWELLRYPGNREAAAGQFSSPRADMSARLGEIEAPTLIIWGDEDPLIPVANAAVFAEMMPNARAVIYEGIGHLPMEEAPDRTAADIAGFLANLP